MNLNEIKFVKLNYGEDIGSIKHLGDGVWITPDGILYIKQGKYEYEDLLPIISSDLCGINSKEKTDAVAREGFLCVDSRTDYGSNIIAVLISPKVTLQQIVSLYNWISLNWNEKNPDDNQNLYLDIQWYYEVDFWIGGEEETETIDISSEEATNILCNVIKRMLEETIKEEEKIKLLKMKEFAETHINMYNKKSRDSKPNYMISVKYGESSLEGNTEGFVELDGTQHRKTDFISHAELLRWHYKEMGLTDEEFLWHANSIVASICNWK